MLHARAVKAADRANFKIKKQGEQMSEAIAKELYSVVTEITEIKEKLDLIKAKKRNLEHEMQKMNNRVRTGGRLPDEEYKTICRKQQKIRKAITELETDMAPLIAEIRHWSNLETELRAKMYGNKPIDSSKPIRKKIVALRNHYLSFAEDHTRVNSMRMMASQIASELTEALQED
jgi:seryl-tRNA synthetase